MKRFLALFLVTGIVLAGCGGSSEEPAETETTTETAEEETEAAETETEEETETAEAAEEQTEAETEAPEETTAAPAEAVPETTKQPETEAPVQQSAEETPAAQAAALSCGEIYNKCISGGSLEELVSYDETYMLNYFGIDTSALGDFAAGEALDAVKADALIILKANDTAQAAELQTKLNDYITRKKAELENYNAEEFKKASNGIVGTSGNYVYLIVCNNPSAVLNIIEENI
ncbi:MAG: DUF4358 domain-containing protein [Clostridiales bacterium]|nr:DUF4358 domain-containing protein [Clostridiales bacterium]